MVTCSFKGDLFSYENKLKSFNYVKNSAAFKERKIRAIHHKKRDGSCEFYHIYLADQAKPTGHIDTDRCDSTAVIPIPTALLLSNLINLQFFFVFFYTLLEFCAQSNIGKCTSRHLFPYSGLATRLTKFGVTLACIQRKKIFLWHFEFEQV